MPKPYPDPTTVGNMTTLFSYANTVTNGWIFTLFLMATSIIIIFFMNRQGQKLSDSLLVGFFISFIFSSFFWASGLVLGRIVVIFILLTIASAIYSYLDS